MGFSQTLSPLTLVHLYLIRHAHAEDGKNDDARPLSAKGRSQIRRVGRWLRDAEAIDVCEFWHSPLVRSRDTAIFLAKQLKLDAPLREVSGLKPEDDPATLARKIRDAKNPLAIVGHEPHLSALASLLVVGESEPPRFKMKKCTVLRLERSGTGWSVRWQISPELI
jgi:phosphohistidine phosphatase